MIDDEHRGYLIELMATKLLSLSSPVQIVGMSATLTVRDLYLRFEKISNSNRISSYWPDG